MTKYAIKDPRYRAMCWPVDPVTKRELPSITRDQAVTEGYALVDDPLADEAPRPRKRAAAPVPAPVAAAQPQPDPMLVERLERAARIAAPHVGFAAALTLAQSDLDESKAKAFLRGLPAAADLDHSTSTNQAKDTTEMSYPKNMPDTDRARLRAVELKLVGIEARAASGDPAAQKKRKEIAYARSVAASTGKSLIETLATLNVSLA